MVGEIFLAKVHFTDESGYKIRPVLILKENSFGDFVFTPLTTNLEISGVLIAPDDILTGCLPKRSIVVTEKLGVIAPSLLTKRIAKVQPNCYIRILESIIQFLRES